MDDLHQINFPLGFSHTRPCVSLTISNFGGEYYNSSLVLQSEKTHFVPQTNANSYRSLYWMAIGF